MKVELGDKVIVRNEHLEVISPPRKSSWGGKEIVRLTAMNDQGRTIVLDHGEVDSIYKRTLPRGSGHNCRPKKVTTTCA
jgi:hypothetical protein